MSIRTHTSGRPLGTSDRASDTVRDGDSGSHETPAAQAASRVGKARITFRGAVIAVVAAAAVVGALYELRKYGAKNTEDKLASQQRQFERDAEDEYTAYCRKEIEGRENTPPEEVGNQMVMMAMHCGEYDQAMKWADMIYNQGAENYVFDSKHAGSMARTRINMMRAERQGDKAKAGKDYEDAIKHADEWLARDEFIATTYQKPQDVPNWEANLAKSYALHKLGRIEEARTAFITNEASWKAMHRWFNCVQQGPVTPSMPTAHVMSRLQTKRNRDASLSRFGVLESAYGQSKMEIAQK
jgi:tetratricopeptide (TPR) repeat protein